MNTTQDIDLKRERAVKILTDFMASLNETYGYNFTGDASICTSVEWKARGEPYGRESLATLLIDSSPLYQILNYCENEKSAEIAEWFSRKLEEAGFYFELGFAWSVHIYEI